MRDAIRFVHEAGTDTDMARLFAACRAGHLAVLAGSTEKMGVGTNVQDRAIALHHLDAPWRPADVEQRDGRILRQGNLNKDVRILRYVTAGSFDGYMWQTLERKAQFIGQVMRGHTDVREIGDIGDAALSFSEVKALATGNPLLIDKAEADAELARLQRAERAHRRNQDALRHAITRHEQERDRLARLGTIADSAISRRQDTRGDAFVATIAGQAYARRSDAGRHLIRLLQQAVTGGAGGAGSAPSGHLGGFPLTISASRAAGAAEVAVALDGAPGTEVRLSQQELRDCDPVKLITRLENRLARLETVKTRALSDMEHTRNEISHATTDIGRPFPHVAELAAARELSAQIDQQLQEAATPQDTDQADVGSGHTSGPACRAADHAPVREDERSATPPPTALQRASAASPAISYQGSCPDMPDCDRGTRRYHDLAGTDSITSEREAGR